MFGFSDYLHKGYKLRRDLYTQARLKLNKIRQEDICYKVNENER